MMSFDIFMIVFIGGGLLSVGWCAGFYFGNGRQQKLMRIVNILSRKEKPSVSTADLHKQAYRSGRWVMQDQQQTATQAVIEARRAAVAQAQEQQRATENMKNFQEACAAFGLAHDSMEAHKAADFIGRNVFPGPGAIPAEQMKHYLAAAGAQPQQKGGAEQSICPATETSISTQTSSSHLPSK